MISSKVQNVADVWHFTSPYTAWIWETGCVSGLVFLKVLTVWYVLSLTRPPDVPSVL